MNGMDALVQIIFTKFSDPTEVIFGLPFDKIQDGDLAKVCFF